MKEKKSLLIAICAYLLLFAISFWPSIIMGLGPAESTHDPHSLWMYIRRLLLIACALLLPQLAGSKGPLAYGWKIPFKWLLIAIPLGVLMGLNNPGGFDPRHGLAVLLACMHAFATELFFRAYLITTLSGVFKKFWPPILISSLMYGLYYLTVWEVWIKPTHLKPVFVGLFTCIGIIHGYCYAKSKSFITPWLVHFLGVLKYRSLV